MPNIDRNKRTAGGLPKLTFQEMSRLRAARAKEFTIQGQFKFGYRNKEDISNLPPPVLVVGSQNVLTNAAEQVTIRNGYSLDGPAGNQNTYGIDSAYDFDTHVNGIRNLRKWGTTLEVRYENPVTGDISWITLLNNLSTNVVNFTDFWDFNGELLNYCLFVNGDNTVYEWSGGVGSVESVTADTITVSGTDTLAQLSFYGASSGKQKLLINGTAYTYTARGASYSTIFDHTSTNNKTEITPTQWMSQKFTTGATATLIHQVTLKINSAAGSTTTSNFTGYIYTDNAGVPGTVVATVRSSLAGSYSMGDFSIPFIFDAAISPNTNYHFVVSSDQTTTDLSVYTGNSAAVGTNKSTDGGTSWGTVTGYMYVKVEENDVSQQTFVGVSPNPTGQMVAGDAVVQAVAVGTTAAGIASNNSPNNIPNTFSFDLIATLRNQVYYGDLGNHTVFITKVNDYKSVTFSTPRVVGEGALAVLDSPPIAFVPQDDGMYLSGQFDYWYKTRFTLSADLAKESFEINRLKTTAGQGTQSQALTGKLKNSIIYVSKEPIFNSLGSVKNVLADPQVVNMSDSIKYDMDAYDFSGGQVYYDNYFIYLTIPAMGIERLFNVVKKYWEAPQVVPFSRHYRVGEQLCAHSALTNESYQCYVSGVYNDNGNPIKAVIAFPYVSQEGGSASQLKNFNKVYTEGYIAANTTLMLTINYDFGGFTSTYTTLISGSDAAIIFNKITDGSIGQNSLGNEPIGSILNIPNQPAIPKFRVINTMPRQDAFEYQIVFSTDDVDQNFAILRFGPSIAPSTNIPTFITE